MRQDVLELRQFYASPLGMAAARLIAGKLSEAWGDMAGQDVLTLGYGLPHLAAPEARRLIAAMPAAQGVEVWPTREKNRACLVEDAALPFANALFDRVLAIHALEESDSPLAAMREVERVLSPAGRVIVAVTARRGLWANIEATPFGHGRPFSQTQLRRLLIEADLEPVTWTRVLYLPPTSGAHRWADAFERVGARLWPPFAGLILMEAVKPRVPERLREIRARVRAIPVFQPASLARRMPNRRQPG